MHDGIKKASKIGHFVRYRSADACGYLSTILPPFWRLQRLMDEATTATDCQLVHQLIYAPGTFFRERPSIFGPFLDVGWGACTIWIAVLRNTASCDQPQRFACENDAAIEGNAMPYSPRLEIFVPKSTTVGWTWKHNLICRSVEADFE